MSSIAPVTRRSWPIPARSANPGAVSKLSFLPQPLPPRCGPGLWPGDMAEAHPLADTSGVPTRQRCQALRLLLVTVVETTTIVVGGRARVLSRPLVAKDIASLEVAAIGRLLEHEILGEVRVVVTQVQSREKHIRHVPRRRNWHGTNDARLPGRSTRGPR